ncbi:unnamed protein product [Closterium sp. NIES-65]|nr:unnamed protein product [Closterium sp. NIES-65]
MWKRSRRHPLSGPVAAHPFSSPVAALQRPRHRTSVAQSPHYQRPVAALSAARRRPFSGPAAALPRTHCRSAAQRPSRGAAHPPSSRAAEHPSRRAAKPPDCRAALHPSRQTAEPPSSRAAEPSSHTAAEALPLVGLPATAPIAWQEQRLYHCTALPHYTRCLSTAVMASPSALTFDAEGQAVDFEVCVDDLQLFLHCDRADGLSLFDLTSGASPAPAADADAIVRSQGVLPPPSCPLLPLLLGPTLLASNRSALRLPRAQDAAPARERGARALEGLARAVEVVVEAVEGVGVVVRVVPGVAAAAAAVEAAEVAVVAEGAKAVEVAEEAEVEEASEAAVVERVATLRRGVAQVLVRASSSGVV